MAMAPTSSPSLSIGTVTKVRAPASWRKAARAGSAWYAGSAWASAIWTVCFVAATRPSPVPGCGRSTGYPVLRPHPGTGLGRVAATKQTVQIADAQAEPAYHADPARAAFLHLAGARTFLTVPMLKEGELVGAISIYRQEVRPFTTK